MPQNAHLKPAAPVERGESQGRGAHWETTPLREAQEGNFRISLMGYKFELLKHECSFFIFYDLIMPKIATGWLVDFGCETRTFSLE